MVVIDFESSHRMAIFGLVSGWMMVRHSGCQSRMTTASAASMRRISNTAVRPRCGLRFHVRNDKRADQDQGDDADPEGDGSGGEVEQEVWLDMKSYQFSGMRSSRGLGRERLGMGFLRQAEEGLGERKKSTAMRKARQTSREMRGVVGLAGLVEQGVVGAVEHGVERFAGEDFRSVFQGGRLRASRRSPRR